MLGFMLSTPIIDNEAVFASMSAFKPANTNAVEQWNFNASEIELNIAIPDHNTATGMAEERNNTTAVEAENMYYVIVASLPNEEIAQKILLQKIIISARISRYLNQTSDAGFTLTKLILLTAL